MSKSVTKNLKANFACDEIRRMIQIADQVNDNSLSAESLSSMLKVSNEALEDTLSRLLGEGQVDRGDEESYSIAPIMISNIRQLSQVREILELAAIKLCIDRMTKEHIGCLYEICEDFSYMVEKGYFAGACEADLEFHAKLVSLSGNSVVQHAYNFSNIPLFQQRIGNSRVLLEEYEMTDREHRQIVGSLKKRNLAQSEKTLKNHLVRETHDVLQYYLECV